MKLSHRDKLGSAAIRGSYKSICIYEMLRDISKPHQHC